MKAILITPEQASNFAIKHYVPEHKKDIYCKHNEDDHEILIPQVPRNENDYYPGVVKICKICNREVESDFLMKDIVPDNQKAYISPWKGLSKTPYSLSQKSKTNPPAWKQKTEVYIKSPFIF